ncbi:PEP-CTERM sorting domain-containing protein [Coraliomargarita sp. SDUM461003]|uniref:PEP-CTERM sorting domain-containing protein n=1 Tax=Thalassobacterium maritimum TaxID=3041265 RepID=A0ABU1AVQ0_9BACT|nr:PEP-CTERM sorting domain-containing protein [Coraliomargarita sp. SDUM461003]MDQ8208228.1 PEP-CTERM sorting domain-containing protein [Coraliomargarita sp. SDUM461003]
MLKKKLFLFGLGCGAAFASSQAATIVGYDFTAGTPQDASFEASNVTASSFNLNAANTGFDFNDTVGDSTGTTAGIDFSEAAGNFRATNGLLLNGNRDAAIAAGDYFSFTLTPDTGFEMNLDAILFSASRAGNNTKSAESFALMSSITGFEDTDTSVYLGAVTTVAGGLNPYQQFSVDVSGVSAFQNITTATEFRVYVWGGTGGVSSSAINYDNVGVIGDVSAVPEPSTYALLAGCLALSSVMLRRRRA